MTIDLNSLYPVGFDDLPSPTEFDSHNTPGLYHDQVHAKTANIIEAMQAAFGLMPLSKDAAAASDHLARIKAAADSQYRLLLGLDSSSAPQLLFGGGSAVAPDVRIRRDAATGLLLDNGAGGLGRLNITGSLRADFTGGPGGTPLFEVNASTHRVSIGGGLTVNLLTIGKRSETQIEVIVGDQSAYLRGRLSTALTTLLQTQANLNFTPTDWNASASRDLASSISARGDGAGSAYFTFDAPGNEMLHIYPSGLLGIRQEALGDGFQILKPSEAHRRFFVGYDSLAWGPGTAAPDSRIKRTGTKKLTFDDGAGGAGTFDFLGEVQINGAPVDPAGVTPPLNLWVGPIPPWLMTVGRTVAANRAHYEAFQVTEPVTVTQAHVYLTASAGNVDLAICAANGNRLGSTGSVASPTVNTYATIALTAPVDLVPGVKYLAAGGSTSASTSFLASSASVVGANTVAGQLGLGYYLETSIPVPATATLLAAQGYGGIGIWFD